MLALKGEVPSGFVMVQNAGGEAEVLTLVVAPAFRRSGVARKLMQWAIKATHEGGAERLVLEVSEQNHAARALYFGLGFFEIGQRSVKDEFLVLIINHAYQFMCGITISDLLRFYSYIINTSFYQKTFFIRIGLWLLLPVQ